MDSTVAAVLTSWPFDPWIVAGLVVTAAIYLRGWLHLRRHAPRRFGATQLTSFLGGLVAIFLALASPIEPFATLLLQVHMVQHLLLMVAAPPLLWLGAPLLPLLRGLPVSVRLHWIAPWWQAAWLRCFVVWLSQPLVASILFLAATWLWHAPYLYELALRSDGWHYLQHACFFLTGLLFWFPVVQPYPGQPSCSRWVILPYLLLADLQNTALSALLAFSDRVLYPHYQNVPRLWGISALDDQAAAGVIMWVPGSIAYLVPLVVIAHRLLHGSGDTAERIDTATRRRGDTATFERIPLPLQGHRVAASPRPSVDLLHLPLLGRFLGWRHARPALQVPLFLLALAIIVDGLWGPQVTGMNLAGVLPWIHWRGLVVLGLLIAGNFFCMACPFQLPRSLAKRWLPTRWSWPRALRNKWLAIVLLIVFFWAYEVFSLWDSPWWTAWIALAYFLAAFVIDACFRGAVFCKYVCPIGQFHFVHSFMSPLEVKVRNLDTCLTCTTKECIRGTTPATSSLRGYPESSPLPRTRGRGVGGEGDEPREILPPRPLTPTPLPRSTGGEGLSGQPLSGCELHLFQPRKTGNMDCTFCLDCIHACPHDNVGILAVTPGAELLHDRQRSGIGRLSRRIDVAALVLVLVFAAFANAAGMVAPVVAWQDGLASSLGLESRRLVVTALLIAALLVVPLLITATTLLARSASDGSPTHRLRSGLAMRFVYTLIPLGFFMWLAHYSFHFLTSADAAIPVLQRFAADVGLSLGEPRWACGCCGSVAGWLLRLEILFLDVGLLGSLYLGYRLAVERQHIGPALKTFAPWAVLMIALFVAGIWIIFQPMEMRGMLPG